MFKLREIENPDTSLEAGGDKLPVSPSLFSPSLSSHLPDCSSCPPPPPADLYPPLHSPTCTSHLHACLICIHMSQRERGFVGRRNRRGKRRYAGRWRLMKPNEKHSFRLCLSPVSPSMALAPFTLPPLRFCPHTL